MSPTKRYDFETAGGLRALTTAQWTAIKHDAIARAREERRRAMQAFLFATMRPVRRLLRGAVSWTARRAQAQMLAQRQRRDVLGFAGVDRTARLH